MKTLLKNTNYGYIVIDGNLISYIGDEKPEGDFDSVKDMRGKMIYPGFYNTHAHTAMSLLRGVGSDKPLKEWLFDCVFPVEDRLRPHDVRVGMELSILEMLETGTVAFEDMYFMYDDAMYAIIDSGIKANISRSLQSSDPDEPYEKSYRVREAHELYNNYNDAGDGRIKINFSVHAEYTTSEKIIRGIANDEIARKARMSVHLAETKKEVEECIIKRGMSPVAYLNKLGLFEIPTCAAHCVWINDDDIEILKAKNVGVAHCPSSNMKLASGFAPVAKLLRNGVTVGLGTDGAASNNNVDMIEEMHIASLIHKGFRMDPTTLSAKDAIKMATLSGAKIMGRENCGEIKVGNRADLIAIDFDSPHMRPNIDSDALIVYSAQGSDVCMTMVDGKILYENGEYLTLDKERIYAEVEESRKHLYG